jgi:hypothetical protein
MIFFSSGNDDRRALLSSVQQMLDREREQAARDRAEFFRPDETSPEAYAGSLARYREALTALLGWPLTAPGPAAGVDCVPLGRDEWGRIFRVTTRFAAGPEGYGLLFLPETPGCHPLVFALHGGAGSPELAAGLLPEGPANYREMIRGLRARGAAVFAPQLMVWTGGPEPQLDQYLVDRAFRQLGGSRAAWDLCQLREAFAWLGRHPEVDGGRIAVAGLSYGGFYALYFGALEPRLRAVACSCFLNDRFRYAWEDWVWMGSARKFLDAEVARMICPRPLFLEAGAGDAVFAVEGFSSPAQEVSETYRRLGFSERCCVRVHSGGHEYDPDGRAEAFLSDALGLAGRKA